MNIRLAAFLPVKGTYRFLNPVLGAAAVVCAVMLAKALWQPVYVLEDSGSRSGTAGQRDITRSEEPRPTYSVIVEKDLFSPIRRKYSPPSKPVIIQPPPSLTLIGTVLLDDGEAAILDFPGRGHRSTYFRVGDVIEGFVIKEIRKDAVLVEKNGEGLRASMRAPSSSSESVAHGAQAILLRAPSRLPPQFSPPPAR